MSLFNYNGSLLRMRDHIGGGGFWRRSDKDNDYLQIYIKIFCVVVVIVVIVVIVVFIVVGVVIVFVVVIVVVVVVVFVVHAAIFGSPTVFLTADVQSSKGNRTRPVGQ